MRFFTAGTQHYFEAGLPETANEHNADWAVVPALLEEQHEILHCGTKAHIDIVCKATAVQTVIWLDGHWGETSMQFDNG